MKKTYIILMLLLHALFIGCSNDRTFQSESPEQLKDSIKVIDAKYFDYMKGKKMVSVVFEVGNYWNNTKTYRYSQFRLVDKQKRVIKANFPNSHPSYYKVSPLTWQEFGLVYEVSDKINIKELDLIYSDGKDGWNKVKLTLTKGTLSF